jgi:hypothetical protein
MTGMMRHNGSIIPTYIEMGFDQVKYFEGDITSTASGFTISPPARKLVINNCDSDHPVYLRINGSPATTSVGFTPGDNIKIEGGSTFEMDFDALTEISLVTEGPTVSIKGLLGYKGTVCWG